MATQNAALSPVWDDMDRAIGSLFMMGFDGSTVTPQIKTLIEDYHLGSILLKAQNLKSAEQTAQLVLELQTIAHNAGHPFPLAIALDQENGGVNSLYDEIFIRQFPSAMGLAATGSKKLAREVARATAQELSSVGVNWILGPVLDVLTNARNQPLGVRATGDDPQEVSVWGVEFMKGYQEARLATCGKHFPSYGNLEFLGSPTDVPVIRDSLEQLSQSAFVPFRSAIAQGLDAMMVGGCAMSSENMNVMHACLSEQVIEGLLRSELKFGGVVVSECLEMEALTDNIGVGGGTVMAVKAGCDIILICRSFSVQQEAINGLKLGVENGIIEKSKIRQSLKRVLDMKSKYLSWEKTLGPAGTNLLAELQLSHTNLSNRAYNTSITVVRDKGQLLPLTNVLANDDELLLLTPLLKPLPASAASQHFSELLSDTPPDSTSLWAPNASIMSGERVFRELGRSLARRRNGRLLHTSYTANGVRPVHEDLISRASAVIIVTADSNRNLYQNGFTKHVSMICRTQASINSDRKEKPLVVVSVSSPYDFAADLSIGTYICTYDFTEIALQALAKVLYGELVPSGSLPGTMGHSQKTHQSRQHWLVETWNETRDFGALDSLLRQIRDDNSFPARSELTSVTASHIILNHPGVEEAHFVVRNSSTKELYGFCATYYFKTIGTAVIGVILVSPGRRRLSIGHSLHNRAIRALVQCKGVKRLQLGSRLPNIYLGIPTGNPIDRKKLRQWFANMGWNMLLSRPVCSLVLSNLQSWIPPEGVRNGLKNKDVQYDLVYGTEYADTILDHIKSSSRQGVSEIYKMALADKTSCGIIRAKNPTDGALLGTVVLYKGESKLATHIPAIMDTKVSTGGISCPVISTAAGEYTMLMQGLILLGIRQIKMQGSLAVLLDCVDGDNNFDSLSAMGFTIHHSFEEMSSDVAAWSVMPPS